MLKINIHNFKANKDFQDKHLNNSKKAAFENNCKWLKNSFELFPVGFYFCICIKFINEIYQNLILEPGLAVISYIFSWLKWHSATCKICFMTESDASKKP